MEAVQGTAFSGILERLTTRFFFIAFSVGARVRCTMGAARVRERRGLHRRVLQRRRRDSLAASAS
jgi:hypothetical protein